MLYIADMIAGKSFCPFSFAAVWGLQSNIARVRPEFEDAVARASGQPVLPVRPIYRPDAGTPSGLHDARLPEERQAYLPLRPR